MANESLGTRQTPCPDCGENAQIFQAKRKGAHLYTRCACGLDQKTGAAFQLKVWKDANWSGHPPTPPTNIEGKLGQMTDEPAPVQDSGDFEPTEIEPKSNQKKKPKGRGGLVAGLFLLLATGGGLWAALRNK